MTVDLMDHIGSDEAVVRAARVSTKGSASKGAEADAGLINYLMRDRHGSPFEHSGFTFYVEAPIVVFREFQRHRIASYNEESGRYKILQPEFYIPALGRPLVQVGKPGAYVFEQGTATQEDIVDDSFADVSRAAWDAYQCMLDAGVAREVARMVLPLNIFSSMYVTMNARSLMNFLSLRSSEQGRFPSFPMHEIADVAERMEALFAEAMPLTHAAFIGSGRVAP